MGQLMSMEYRVPVRFKYTQSGLRALMMACLCVNGLEMPAIELNALREVLLKLMLKLQRRIVVRRPMYSVTFSDTELWALSYVVPMILEDTFESAVLAPVMDVIQRRSV